MSTFKVATTPTPTPFRPDTIMWGFKGIGEYENSAPTAVSTDTCAGRACSQSHTTGWRCRDLHKTWFALQGSVKSVAVRRKAGRNHNLLYYSSWRFDFISPTSNREYTFSLHSPMDVDLSQRPCRCQVPSLNRSLQFLPYFSLTLHHLKPGGSSFGGSGGSNHSSAMQCPPNKESWSYLRIRASCFLSSDPAQETFVKQRFG